MMSQDEERMVKLEDELKAVRTKAEEADKAYDEVFKKIQVTEVGLKKRNTGMEDIKSTRMEENN